MPIYIPKNLEPQVRQVRARVRGIQIIDDDLLCLTNDKKKVSRTTMNAFTAQIQELDDPSRDYVVFSSWLGPLVAGEVKPGEMWGYGSVEGHIRAEVRETDRFVKKKGLPVLVLMRKTCGGNPLHYSSTALGPESGVSWPVTVSVGPVGDNWGDSRSQRGSNFTRKVRICGAFSAEGSFFSRARRRSHFGGVTFGSRVTCCDTSQMSVRFCGFEAQFGGSSWTDFCRSFRGPAEPSRRYYVSAKSAGATLRSSVGGFAVAHIREITHIDDHRT
jgi:hypothetical protein